MGLNWLYLALNGFVFIVTFKPKTPIFNILHKNQNGFVSQNHILKSPSPPAVLFSGFWLLAPAPKPV